MASILEYALSRYETIAYKRDWALNAEEFDLCDSLTPEFRAAKAAAFAAGATQADISAIDKAVQDDY